MQEMVDGGVEMLVGMTRRPDFGPIVACGAGGVTVELTRDVAVRMAPLTDLDAGEMVRSLATFPLLDGFRGAPPQDVRALEDVILRRLGAGRRPAGDRRAGLQPRDRPRTGRGHRRRAGERALARARAALRRPRRHVAACPGLRAPIAYARNATSTVPESGLSPMADGLDLATIALDLQEERR